MICFSVCSSVIFEVYTLGSLCFWWDVQQSPAQFTRFGSHSLYLSEPLKAVRLKQANTWFTSDYVDAPHATAPPFLSFLLMDAIIAGLA